VAGDELCAKVTVAHDLALAELVLRSADGQEASW
jgi:2-C-methyl-D-erythritol 4-phosphate cytidylyltransferase